MGRLVVAAEEVHVVGAHDPHAQLGRQGRQQRVGLVLLGDSLVLDLDEEPLAAEDVQVLPGDLPGLFGLARQQRRGHLPAQTRRRAHQPFVQFAQQLPIDARAVVKALQVRPR